METKFTMVLSPELAQKMSYIAKYNGRSRIKEIEQACKDHVRYFEETVETIKLESPQQ